MAAKIEVVGSEEDHIVVHSQELLPNYQTFLANLPPSSPPTASEFKVQHLAYKPHKI